jgi:hypothetical protein
VGTWRDPELGRPIAAPLERWAQLLGVDLATVREAAAKVEPYVRRRGGYLDRRRTQPPTRECPGGPSMTFGTTI